LENGERLEHGKTLKAISGFLSTPKRVLWVDSKAILISYYTMNNCIVQEAIFALSKIGVEIVKWQRKRCTRQFALIVERNVKSHSSLTQVGLFTAESAGQREEPKDEDISLS
jgi:hypothetical protein